ncbi:ABC superfamily ATP binding cassette transporter [Nitrospirillum viridazoti Y2]|nr:ABC superfamily ATP binding cassette transporter [Nitrospirillum amazonense Y2]
MPPVQPALELNGLTLTLESAAGRVNILKGIDLSIQAGERISIVGPSGSGKSSLMMVIGGLERPTGGTVTVAAQTLNNLSEDALARFRRDHVGIVFQSFHLMAAMTALENVALPMELAGEADAFDRARDGLAAVGLSHRLDHYPGQLSGGEQQRVALARAFAPRPRLILADEPTGNLDQETGGADHPPDVRPGAPPRHHPDPGDARPRPGRPLRPHHPPGRRPGGGGHRRGARSARGLRRP